MQLCPWSVLCPRDWPCALVPELLSQQNNSDHNGVSSHQLPAYALCPVLGWHVPILIFQWPRQGRVSESGVEGGPVLLIRGLTPEEAAET